MLPRGKVVNKEIQKRSKSCCHSSEKTHNCFFLGGGTNSADNEVWHCQHSRRELGTRLGKVLHAQVCCADPMGSHHYNYPEKTLTTVVQ